MEKEWKQVRESIRGVLEVNRYGDPKRTRKNVEFVIKNDPELKGIIRKNLLTQNTDIVGETSWSKENHRLGDEDYHRIYLILEAYGLIGVDSYVETAIRVTAADNAYHPLREKLEALEWDGTPRLRHALCHFLGADVNDLNEAFLKVFMFGALERIFNPGCKFEYMLCLVGGQGNGKSSFFRLLAMEDAWFSDSLRKLDEPKVFEKLQGHWIMEMAEMLATNSAKSVEDNKAFISMQYDNYRFPYNKLPQDIPRQCVFCGSSNKKNFLPFDRTGNRRFLPIETGVVEPDKHILTNEEESRAYILQMWAEAMALYKNGDYSLTLSAEIEKQASIHRMNFMAEDTEAGMIISFLQDYKEDYVCSQMLYREALGYSDKMDKRKSMEINDIMNNCVEGWVQGPSGTHRFDKYGTQRYWIRAGKRVNESSTDAEGFIQVSEQMEIPFD